MTTVDVPAPSQVGVRRLRRGARLGRRLRRSALLTAPLALYVFAFCILPVGLLLLYSFWQQVGYEIVHTLTWSNYVQAWTTPIWRTLLMRSVGIGFAATILIIAVAYPIAYYLAFRARRHRDVLLFLVLLSLFGNYLVRIYAWRSILSTNGLIDTLARALGLSHSEQSYLIFTLAGTLVVLANIYLPFAVLPIYSSLLNIPETLVAVGRDLGASPKGAFLRITAPLSAPGVLAAFAFVFLLASSDFVTPLLVGGVSGVMVGVEIQNQFEDTMNWPLGSALAFSYTLVLIAVLAATVLLAKIAQHRRAV
jgi:spermidine/putrescine transport system permease protein